MPRPRLINSQSVIVRATWNYAREKLEKGSLLQHDDFYEIPFEQLPQLSDESKHVIRALIEELNATLKVINDSNTK